MPDFESDLGGLSEDFFDVGTDQIGGIGGGADEVLPDDPIVEITPEEAFDSESYGEMQGTDTGESDGGGGGEMTTTPETDTGEPEEPETPISDSGNSEQGRDKEEAKPPKGNDPVTQITTGLGVLKNVLESLTKLKGSPESKEPGKTSGNPPAPQTPPKQGGPSQPLPYPVQLDDIPVTVPTGGKPGSARPAKAPASAERTLDRVRTALARVRKETPQ